MDCSPLWLLCPWDSPGKNTGVDCHALLQGIFPTQGPVSRLNKGCQTLDQCLLSCAINAYSAVNQTLHSRFSDAGRDWGQEEKGMTEDKMAGWHHQLDGHEFE